MLPCVCSVTDHRGRQNVARTSVTHSAIASYATFLFLPHFDVICDLLLNRCTATWNVFVNVISKERIKDRWPTEKNWCTNRIFSLFIVWFRICCRRNYYFFQFRWLLAQWPICRREFSGTKGTKNNLTGIALWKATATPFSTCKMRLLFLILIASEAKYKGQKFIEKEKFVPKEEIEGFQYDTLKRVFLVTTSMSHRQRRNARHNQEFSNEGLGLNSFVVSCNVPSLYSCLQRRPRDWDL